MATPPLNLRPLTPPPGEDSSSPSAASFSYESSPHLYLFTSLTAGSSHIITATSRLETILKANRVPFKAVDCATDEKARRIWSRRAGKRKLPGLVKEGTILADLELVEEWNEFGEIKEHLGGGLPPAQVPAQGQAQSHPASQPVGSSAGKPAGEQTTSESASASAAASTTSKQPTEQQQQQQQQSMLAQQVAAIAAQRGKAKPASTTASSTTATESGPLATTSEEPKQSTTTDNSTASRSPPPRSPERDEDRDMEDTTHNTTISAALPPLSIRTANNTAPATSEQAATETRGRADTTTSVRSIQSPNIPNAPPSTAVDATPPTSQLSLSFEPKDSETITEEELSDPAASAGPASKSGLEAVSSSEDVRHERRTSNLSPASPEEVAEIEKRDSIPEVSNEAEISESQPERPSSSQQKTVEVTYGDGYDRSHDVQDNDDDEGDNENDDEGEYEDDSGQLVGREALNNEDDGTLSPRILQNDRNRHIKFSDDQQSRPSEEGQGGNAGAATDANKAGESVVD